MYCIYYMVNFSRRRDTYSLRSWEKTTAAGGIKWTEEKVRIWILKQCILIITRNRNLLLSLNWNLCWYYYVSGIVSFIFTQRIWRKKVAGKGRRSTTDISVEATNERRWEEEKIRRRGTIFLCAIVILPLSLVILFNYSVDMNSLKVIITFGYYIS